MLDLELHTLGACQPNLHGGDVEHLGRHPDGALDLQILALGTLHQIAADCSKRNAAKTNTRSVLRFQPNAAETNKGNGIHRHATEHGLIAAVPFSRFLTLLEESVMRILCCGSIMPASNPALPDFIGGAYATSAAAMARGRRGSWGGTDSGARVSPRGSRRREVAAESARLWGARGGGVYVEAGRWRRDPVWPLDVA